MSKSVAILIFVISILLIGGGLYFATLGSSGSLTSLTPEFAQCLTDKGMTMYGAYWCPHCQKVKKDFGEAFSKINYVECTVETQKCTDAKVNGYPTFTFADGTRIEGEPKYSDLASKTACPLPNPTQ